MKVNRLFFALFFAFIVGCSTQAADNTVLKVETVSVQELDDEKYIKEQEKKGEAKLTKKYSLDNNNYKTISDDKFDECSDLENNTVGAYTIKNEIKKITIDKINYSYTIYKSDDKGACKKIKTTYQAHINKAIEYNGSLYVEIEPKKNNDANIRKLYKLDGTKLKLIKDEMKPFNNMAVVGEYLFISNGYRLDVINKKDSLTNIKKKIKESIWTISSREDTLYILFKNKKTDVLSVSSYKLPEEVVPKNIEDLTFENNKKLVFRDKSYSSTIEQDVTKETEDYVIFGDKMICKNDYSSCKYVEIDGETIQNVIGDYVIYNSDKTYLSNYNSNTKESLSSLIIKYASLNINEKKRNNKELLFKIYTENNKDHDYFQYELDSK